MNRSMLVCSVSLVFLFVFGAGAVAQDYVIGEFEGTTLGDGWGDWNGFATFTNSTTGATEGSQSIRVVPDAIGYEQNLFVKIQDLPDNVDAFDGFMNNTHLAVDVTWDPSEWTYSGEGWNGSRLLLYYNEMGSGWQDNIGVDIGDTNGFRVPHVDTGNSENPGFWDIENYPELHTRTMMWDYSEFLPLVTSDASNGWIELILANNGGSFSTYAFYFDNIRFTTPPEGLPGDYNGDGWVNAADYTVFRDHLGEGDESALNGNGDGMNGVDAGDYTLWVESFNTHLGEGAGSLGAGSVPEPGTLVFAAMAAGLLGVIRRRNG